MIWDRKKKEYFEEDVLGSTALGYVYGDRIDQRVIRFIVSRFPLISALYGFLQKTSFSKRKIERFIQRFQIDTSEFLKKDFTSFNDFFVRGIKPRPLPSDPFAIIPADGRYRFFENVDLLKGVWVKGAFLSLEALVGDREIAERYKGGSMVIARLAPPDYHRFHAVASGRVGEATLIPGSLYSVSRLAMAKERYILSRNRRVRSELATEKFGRVLYIEVGATNVGSIQQTKKAGDWLERGEEKGYFAFGGSLIVLLFEKEKIRFSADLLRDDELEIRCLMGEEMGLPV